MAEPERIIEVKEFVCPFCGTNSSIKTKDAVISEKGGYGFDMDGWTCNVCGSDNDIFHDSDFTDLTDFTAERLSNMNNFDIVHIFQFASYLVQKKEFEKSAKIMRHILSQYPDYYECKYLLERAEKVIELNKLSSSDIDIDEVMFAMEDHSSETVHFLNKKTGRVVSLSESEDENKIEEVSHSNDYLYIEPFESNESYRKMEEFIEMVDDKGLKEKLVIAIQGPGAFRRFKDVLAGYSGTTEYRQMWFDFYNSFIWNEAMDFLIDSLSKGKTEPQDFIEVNGTKYPIFIEEKDIKNSYARFYENKLLITLSSNLSDEEKKIVVERLKKRMQNPRRNRFIEPLREFKDGDVIDLGSKKYTVKIDMIDKNSSSGKLVGNIIHLRIASRITDDYKKKHAYELVRKILSLHRRAYLRRKLKELNKHHFNTTFKDVRWKKQLSQWGSCSENKYINISYRLLFAPDDVLEYVCIHELAHLLVFNHSERFWKLVKKAMPDCEEKEQWLKENGAEIF